jgi:hypothetical protein
LEASKRTQDWLKENLQEAWDKEVWSPSSPDYSLLDNFVCGVSELLLNAKPHNKTGNLIQKMKVLMSSLNRAIMAKAY